jgi:hypothetical protein
MKHCLVRVLGVVVLVPLCDASAQIIPVKTVPIAEGDQFTFLPSENRGMANVGIALADSLLDPFTNPATGARVRRSYVFSSPSVYSLSRNRSNGSTLPVGAFLRGKSVFASAGFALQKLTPPRQEDGNIFAISTVLVPGSQIEPRSNQYAFALIGSPSRGLLPAWGASLFWSRLGGVEGTELLYPLSRNVKQHADAVTLRAGMVKELTPRQSLEAVIVHNRFASQHEVNYLEFIWDPVARRPLERVFVEQNFERTHMWGIQIQHRRTLSDSTWTIGTSVLANRNDRLDHPTRGMMSVTRDPGESSALNAGVGVARTSNGTTFAADAIYEPIWSRARESGTEVSYRFSNAILRGGVKHELISESADVKLQLQLGMQLRSINHSQRSWTEWLHTWGMSVRALEFDLHYQGRVHSGVSRPGAPEFPNDVRALDVIFSPFAQPRPVLLPVRVTTHHLSISVPIQ